MSRNALFLLLVSLATPSSLLSWDRLFFEAGPQFLVTLDDDELDHYWGEGIGASGSIGIQLIDQVALVPTASFATVWPKWRAPTGGVEYGEGDDPIVIIEPRANGERANVYQTGLNLRLSRGEPDIQRMRSFFTIGLMHVWEPGVLSSMSETGGWFVGPGERTFYLSVGGGLTLDLIQRFPLAVEAGFQAPLDGAGTFLPIQASLRF